MYNRRNTAGNSNSSLNELHAFFWETYQLKILGGTYHERAENDSEREREREREKQKEIERERKLEAKVAKVSELRVFVCVCVSLLRY